MKPFHNILFVSSGLSDEAEALQHAIQLANDSLDILIISPELPKSFDQYKASYELFLKEHMDKVISAAKVLAPAQKKKLPIKVDIEWNNKPEVRIIQRVLTKSHDLLIKAVEHNESTKGFRALDMALLRKCPCTLFLHRPFKHSKDLRVAVAIDPHNEDISGHRLTISLLKLAQTLATHYEGKLNIISCWDYPLEHYLRYNYSWNEMPQHDLEERLLEERNANYQALGTLIHEADIGDKQKILHLKGDPIELIPSTITDKKIDILVMGTIARAGVSGFIIGNTAENILQKVDCSLWAMKPQGFVSPVKAE